MLSTRFGYFRPARLAERFARAFRDGDSLVCRVPFGAAFFQGAFGLADFFVDFGIDHFLPLSISSPVTSRWLPISGGVPVSIPFATSNSTTGCGLSTFR